MEFQGWMGKLYDLSEGFVRLVYVNLLWILFTILGLGLLGWAPATASAFATFRHIERMKNHFSVFKYFWTTYRNEFLKANLLGWLYAIVGMILLVDLRLFQVQEGKIFLGLFYFFFGLFVLFLIACTFLFPIYVHYKLEGFLEYVKYSFFIPIAYPLYLLGLAVLMIGITILYIFIPSLGFVLGIGPYFMVITKISLRLFAKIEEAKEKAEASQKEEAKK